MVDDEIHPPLFESPFCSETHQKKADKPAKYERETIRISRSMVTHVF